MVWSQPLHTTAIQCARMRLGMSTNPEEFAEYFNQRVPGAYRRMTSQDVRDMEECGLIVRYRYFLGSDAETARAVLQYEQIREKRPAELPAEEGPPVLRYSVQCGYAPRISLCLSVLSSLREPGATDRPNPVVANIRDGIGDHLRLPYPGSSYMLMCSVLNTMSRYGVCSFPSNVMGSHHTL